MVASAVAGSSARARLITVLEHDRASKRYDPGEGWTAYDYSFEGGDNFRVWFQDIDRDAPYRIKNAYMASPHKEAVEVRPATSF